MGHNPSIAHGQLRFIRSVKSWWDAKAICESLGYGLVTVNDASEANWLHGFEGPHSWWLGYNDTQTEGVWRWSHVGDDELPSSTGDVPLVPPAP